ncbi:MAG: molybdopterin converting factor subunit 1 [Burkholderiales bacterium]
MVRILYFARLREAFGADREQIALSPQIADIAGLLAHLRSRGGPWERELAPHRNFRVAVNQEMAGIETKVAMGDEVALFPPVTGG